MKKDSKYKIAVGILILIIIVLGFFLVSKPKKAAVRVPAVVKGRIAIIIDDLGYNLNNLRVLEQIRRPLTCSVLPNLEYSRRAAEELHARGYHVILHLPMEPQEKYGLEKNTILTSMDEETIRSILRQDLSSIVYAEGVSNHMGSRATEDPATMEAIFKELKKRRLYFLDSYVSSKSVCSQLAAKISLGFAKRDVFLDNKSEPAYIKQQIYKLKSRAGFYGYAIGIGHDRKATLEVLKEMIPELEKEGYRMVFVSDVIKQGAPKRLKR
ncbi:MAG: divergent polysaccharide deacetylase family protein [Candidatus Omnitrophota bacterium]